MNSKPLLTIAALGLCATTWAQAPAFPGAEGNGRYVTGGRGGKVVHVTNLNDSCSGSLRNAVKGTDKKIVVFDVGGVIPLASELKIGANTTILGQTAPYPGITLRYYTVRPGDNNIIRFIRVRRGQEKEFDDGADACWGKNLNGLILDHCSLSWSIDEVGSFYDNNNFTMQWCTLGESLNNAGHDKGAHGYGGIWGGKLASFHHNMIAHVANRAPRFNGARYNWTGYTSNALYSTYKWHNAVQAENVDFRNCLIFDWGTGGCYGGPGGGYINMVNNYYKATPEVRNKNRVTTVSIANSTTSADEKTYLDMTSRYYISGNYVDAKDNKGNVYGANYDWKGVKYDDGVQTINGETYTKDSLFAYGKDVEHINNAQGIPCVRIKLDKPVAPAGEVTTHSAENAYSKIMAYGGASLFRDDVDNRYMTEAKKGESTYTGSVTGIKGLVDKVSDVDGYTEANFPTGKRASDFDTDGDGMPDVWEKANGLNPNDATDATTFTLDTKGYYTNLEIYANSLVEDLMKAENKDAITTFDEYYPSCKKADGLDYYSGRIVERIKPSDPTTPSDTKTEKAIYSTPFTDWPDAAASTTESTVTQTTKYSHETLTFSIFDTQISSTNKNATKFPNWTGGYLMCSKSADPYVVTSPLASITRVHFRHGATGSSRGWKLEVKGDGDADWVVLSNAVATTTTGTDVDVEVNRTNCQLRFTNLNASQNAYLFQLDIYGNVSTGNQPSLASFSAYGKEYTAEDFFSEDADGNYEGTIEVSKKSDMVSAATPITVTVGNGTVGVITYKEVASDVNGSKSARDVTIPVTLASTGATKTYIVHFVWKPDYTVIYHDTDAKVIATQTVEKGNAITTLNDGETVTVPSGSKFRGWLFQANGEEKANDKTTVDKKELNLYALVTDIENDEPNERHAYNLKDKYFYAEDHEGFLPQSGYSYNGAQHGLYFKPGSITLPVTGNAIVIVEACKYSKTALTLSDSKGNILGTIAIPTTDGTRTAIRYTGKADDLSLSFPDGEVYLHALTVINMGNGDIAKNDEGYYVADAGSASSLLNIFDMIAAYGDASSRTKIFLPNGVYDLGKATEQELPIDKLSLIGQNTDSTIIVTAPDASIEGLGKTDLFLNTRKDLYLQDLTLKNALDYYGAGAAGRAAVWQDRGDRTIFRNVKMLSYQDTYYSQNNAMQSYFEDCDIHGTVDFICGGGDVRFQHTTLSLEPRNAKGEGGRTITAPTTTTNYGYVFDDCSIVDLAKGKGDWNYGRTWQEKPICVFLNTTLDDNAAATIVSSRWTQKGMNNTDPKVFGEYGTKNAAGQDITPSSNVIASYGGNIETILSATQAAAYDYDKMFTNWDPKALATQLTVTGVNLSAGILSWDASQGATAYAVFADGKLLDFTTATNLSVDGKAKTYSVRAANAMGGLGPQATVTIANDIASALADKPSQTYYYALQGSRLSSPRQGLNIRVRNYQGGGHKAEKIIVKR